MENTEQQVRRRPSRRRKMNKKLRRFIRKYRPLARKYAPLAILSLILILFIWFVVGSVQRGNQRRAEQQQESLAAQQAQQQQQILWNQEANDLLIKAEALAAAYDYAGAIAMLDTFSGNMEDFNQLVVTREHYVQTKETMVPWNDPTQIPNLSFHMLIAEPYRTFSNSGYFGYPVIDGVFGGGTLANYMVFNLPINIACNSYGYMRFWIEYQL